MNTTTINYAYLAGFLESELTALAYDAKFEQLDTPTEKLEYIKKLIAIANKSAKDFAAKCGTN